MPTAASAMFVMRVLVSCAHRGRIIAGLLGPNMADREADLLIIGAGIVGLATALRDHAALS